MVCPTCEQKAMNGKLNRSEIRRQQKQAAKKNRVYTVTQAELDRMVKRAALELLEEGIKDFRDHEKEMLLEDIHKVLKLNLGIYGDVLGDMGILTRENTEEVLRRTRERWDKIDDLIMNGNMYELQKYASSLGAEDDTFTDFMERKVDPHEIAEVILDIEEDEE